MFFVHQNIVTLTQLCIQMLTRKRPDFVKPHFKDFQFKMSLRHFKETRIKYQSKENNDKTSHIK